MWRDSELTANISPTSVENCVKIIANNDGIEVSGKFDTLSIYNLWGNKVLETADSQVDTTTFTPGAYIVQAFNGKPLATQKIYIR